MLRKKYMYGMNGEISQIISNDRALISFESQGKTEIALLKRSRFYHNGRLIPDNVPFSKYIRLEMQVKFSCHILDAQEFESNNVQQNLPYHWYVMMCWANKECSNENKPKTEVTVSIGLVSVPGSISSMTKRHGILTMIDGTQNEHSIAFLASKVYIHGKRFPSSKMLPSHFSMDDKLFFDAIPCIPAEDKDNCQWFATSVFQGKRPRLLQSTESASDLQANSLMQAIQKCSDGNTSTDNNMIEENKIGQQNAQPVNVKSKLLKVINHHTTNPRNLFSAGYGIILDILNDEFGIILGCFKTNVFQTVLFHRKNAFLFKISLARAKLTEIFVEGDRMRFIAVGAPPNFITDWIAVQVGVAAS